MRSNASTRAVFATGSTGCRKLEANGTRSVLVECSPAIVAQINLVNNFTGSGVVKSFYVPYFCPECDEEKVLLVEASDMGPPPHEPPTCRCDECDLVMDFDDMPDSYFAFLSNQRKLAEPDKINGAMKELARGSEIAGCEGQGEVAPERTAAGSQPAASRACPRCRRFNVRALHLPRLTRAGPACRPANRVTRRANHRSAANRRANLALVRSRRLARRLPRTCRCETSQALPLLLRLGRATHSSSRS